MITKSPWQQSVDTVSEQRSLLPPQTIIWIDSQVLFNSKVDQSIIDIMRPTKSLHLILNTVLKYIVDFFVQVVNIANIVDIVNMIVMRKGLGTVRCTWVVGGEGL